MTSNTDFLIRKHIKCSSNLILSVQCSENHFCKPKNNEGPYTHVEVCSFGYEIDEWINPIVGKDKDGNSIFITYYNVPSISLINLIYKNGGIIEGELPKLIL